MAIPIESEPKELLEEFGVLEKCFFCRNSTIYWHIKTNQPVCKPCSENKNPEDLPRS